MQLRWITDSNTIYRVFRGEEYVGKVVCTLLNDVLTKVTFVWAKDHRRDDIPLKVLQNSSMKAEVLKVICSRDL